MPKSRIALDVMGGDDAPEAVLQGALRACSRDDPGRVPAERLLLVGDPETIEPWLEAHGGDPGFEILVATDVIGMDDSPARVLRDKPEASLPRGVGAVRDGQAGAVVSAGNTGALVGAATLGLRTLSGVRRPAIGVTVELTGHPVTLLDMGANVAPKPEHLLHNAAMGTIYARDCLGVEHPRLGLLNIGSEAHKGTGLLKEARALIEDRVSRFGYRFVGNVEGNDIFEDVVDVVVTDGFTGNVILKLMEGFSGFLLELLWRELKAHDASWGHEVLESIKKRIDYSEYGGALLLGVNGVVVKAHGRSDANAIANALSLARRALDAGVNDHIVQGLATAVAESHRVETADPEA